MFESVDKPAEDGSKPISRYLLGVKFHSLDWYTVYPQNEEDIEKIATLFGAR